MTTAPASPSASAPAPARSSTKTRVAVASGVALLALGAVWLASGRDQEKTENAYVEGNIIQVTPQTSGTVVAINADNTDVVQAGQMLISLNPTDAKLALDRSEAQLARAVRQVRGQFAMASQTQSTIALRRAELARAQADLARRRELAQTGAISAEDFRHAQDSVTMAQASLDAAGQQFAGSRALIDNVALARHPDVLAAASQVQDAYIAAARTELCAPAAGMVTKRNVQLGQRVNPGAPLLAIVPLDRLWVTANFMESQLAHIRVGQSVRMTADVYGRSTSFTGHVLGLDAGTGSAFSLLPAQNATGNWIKVTQRVPVRIAIDAQSLRAAPLRLGLSMTVTVDTRDRAGTALAAQQGTKQAGYQTQVFDDELKGAQQIIARVINENLGSAPQRGK